MSKHTVVFFANGLGDCILTLPSLRALGHFLPAKLTLVTGGCPAKLLFGDAGFSQILEVPMAHAGSRAGRDFDAEALRQKICDADYFISLVPWSSVALRDLVDGLNCEATFGFGAGFDFGLALHLGRDKHAADRTFSLVKRFYPDLDLNNFSYPIQLPDEMVARASEIRLTIGGERRLLVLHEETSDPTKCLDPLRMRQTLATITSEQSDLIAIVVSKNGPRFDISDLKNQVISIEDIPFGLFLALIAIADVFVGVDSVGFHAADLWRIPAVGLFGPSRPEEWGARFSPSCRYVYGNGDMSNISVDAVLDAIRNVTARQLCPV